MTSKRAHGLGLVVVTGLWVAVTGGVFLLVPARGGPVNSVNVTAPRFPGAASAEEPPPQRHLWDRVGDGARAVFRRKAADGPRQAVQDALARLGVPVWHEAGYTGKGIKVAILDSGFRNFSIATGRALPAKVKARSFRRDGKLEARESQHGILCGEVVHHVAPGAEILVANWEPETPSSFLEAVRWARREGAHIISCSMIMPSWSDGEGGGGVHRQLRSLLGPGDRAGDGLFFASAGNTALRHWGGRFQPGRDGWHQWSGGKKDNVVRPLSDGRVSVELTSPDAADLDLVVLDTNANHEVGRARSLAADGFTTAVVRFEPQPGRRYVVRLRRGGGDASKAAGAPRLHLTVLGGKLQHATRNGSVPFPGDGPEVVAVGAADATVRRLNYSSCGPNGPTLKPDLVAAVPFPSTWRPETPFAGTSAAAPQAAAEAALIWSRHPTWTAKQVREAVNKAAQAGKGGRSFEAGHGLVRMPKL